MHTDELKLLIASRLDVLEFLDILGYTMDDLVEIFSDEIEENKEVLSKAVD